MIRYCSNNMSCIPPDKYRDRFVNYMSKVIVKSSNTHSSKNTHNEKYRNETSETNSNSNILIQNNTNNFINIINNNNNIMVKSLNNNPINQRNSKSNSVSFNKEKIIYNLKYGTKEIIKEESEHGGISFASSGNKNKNELNSSFGVDINKENL